MKTVAFSEFRKNASALFDLVENGESLQVRRHGKTIAQIVPAQGQLVPSWKRPHERLVISGPSLASAILEERSRSK
jgi:antitoxin (DNA-binding transcriptional repressor) of toxin-antitoxin stability system